jgi:hypothetical protein
MNILLAIAYQMFWMNLSRIRFRKIGGVMPTINAIDTGLLSGEVTTIVGTIRTEVDFT